MRAVLQRVSQARVSVGETQVGEIGPGILVYLGAAPGDAPSLAEQLAQRLAKMRIFPGPRGGMDRSLLDVGGDAMVISQFTLFADNRRGHRPSFLGAAEPESARRLCALLAQGLRDAGVAQVAEGVFGAHMVVESLNDGPVTVVASLGEAAWETACG